MDKDKSLASFPGLRYSKDGLSVMVTMDTHMKKNGLYPIKIQVAYKRVQRFYPTGKDMSKEDWTALENTKSKKLVAIREDIENSHSKVVAIVKSLIDDGAFSFDSLNLRLGNATSDTLNTAFAAKMEALKKDGAIGNMLNYQSPARSIEQFAGNKISFDSITVDWLRRYEKHLLSEGKSYVTVSMYIRCIRAIMNDAKRVGVIKENQYPFGKGKYEIPTGEGRKLALNMHQIKSIIDYSDGRETTERYRDLWFFSYLCNGVNFADLLQLRYSNIKGDEICWLRQKTIRTTKVKKEICATITPEMQTIIDKWGNPDKKPSNYIYSTPHL